MKPVTASIALSTALWSASAVAAPTSFGFDGGYIARMKSWAEEAATFPVGSRTSVAQADTTVADAAASASATANTTTSHESGGDEFVVLFDSDHPAPPEVEEVLQRLELSSNHSDVVYTFNNSAFRGFTAKMKDHCVEALGSMAEIATVEKKLSIQSQATLTREGSPWGLQRISSSSQVTGNDEELAYTYTYDDAGLGKGVDIYVVDTGINVEHVVFGGRARHGFAANDFNGNHTDGAGHGTHVAGTAAGASLGVASGANIIAVKVLDENGGGSSSDTIAGIDWVVTQHDKRKNDADFVGSVLSMSFGTDSVSDSLTNAIKKAVSAGIHASVAAGNKGVDACTSSPANAGGVQGGAVTVGSIGINDTVSSFSNTGSCTDIFAPGENVLSSYIGGTNVVQYLDGTSMACPHVSGIMAYLIAKDETLREPAAMKAHLSTTALTNLVSGLVLGDAPKILVNNGITLSLAKREGEDSDNSTDSSAASSSSNSGSSKQLGGFTLTSDEKKTWFRRQSDSSASASASVLGDFVLTGDAKKTWF
ncbi:putative peptidase s8 s53 subtilisin kexin sedolisin [Diplodia seriata]|uniref:Putative peptidase s8 s53 subtilisin kexin sedolisin n=1 Tax=Diplodia seriata TaxID=420778 RepID=A0A0G2EVI6_9PEZI|nr:putative peptidase s8 s53 subtilisin kexin sedolisin [Diplodia seriata]